MSIGELPVVRSRNPTYRRVLTNSLENSAQSLVFFFKRDIFIRRYTHMPNPCDVVHSYLVIHVRTCFKLNLTE